MYVMCNVSRLFFQSSGKLTFMPGLPGNPGAPEIPICPCEQSVFTDTNLLHMLPASYQHQRYYKKIVFLVFRSILRF